MKEENNSIYVKLDYLDANVGQIEGVPANPRKTKGNGTPRLQSNIKNTNSWDMKYTDEIKTRIKELTEEGDSVELICKKIGISRDCFYRWRKTKKDFAELLYEARKSFLKGIREKFGASLFKRATGFEFTETETEYVNDGNGQPVVKSQKTTKYCIASERKQPTREI